MRLKQNPFRASPRKRKRARFAPSQGLIRRRRRSKSSSAKVFASPATVANRNAYFRAFEGLVMDVVCDGVRRVTVSADDDHCVPDCDAQMTDPVKEALLWGVNAPPVSPIARHYQRSSFNFFLFCLFKKLKKKSNPDWSKMQKFRLLTNYINLPCKLIHYSSVYSLLSFTKGISSRDEIRERRQEGC